LIMGLFFRNAAHFGSRLAQSYRGSSPRNTTWPLHVAGEMGIWYR